MDAFITLKLFGRLKEGMKKSKDERLNFLREGNDSSKKEEAKR